MNIDELKIIVRKRDINPAKMQTKFSLMECKKEFRNRDDFISFFSISKIMKELFEENFEGTVLEKALLFKKYSDIKSTNNENDFFKIVYRMNEEVCLELSKHIYLYRIVSGIKIGDEPLLPWYYIGNKKYIADIWWEDDEEIIKDIENLSLVNFITKYKGI